MRHQRITRTALLGLAVAALAGPATAGAQDLRTPDARDGTRAAQPRQDLRGPDRREYATPAALTKPDLRSPDTRDAADGRGTFNAPEVFVVKVPQAVPAPAAGGIDWSDAGIGAGSLLGMIVLGVGGALAVTHRRRHADAHGQIA